MTEAGTVVDQDGVAREYPLAFPLPPSTRTVDPGEVQLAFRAGSPSSLYIEAERLQWTVQGATGDLRWKHPDDCLDMDVGPGLSLERAGRYGSFCAGESATLRSTSQDAFGIALHASGVKVVEWHNAQADCPRAQAWCPSGGAREEWTQRSGDNHTTVRRLVFERLATERATLDFAGMAGFAVGGAPIIDVGVDGEVRLPLASAVPPCGQCPEVDGQTLRLAGNFTLQGLSPARGGLLQADVVGDVDAASIDEQSVDPALLAASIGIGAAVVVLSLAAKALLAPLFSRLAPQDSLEHPARRRILSFIQENPGAKLRESMRGADLPLGTFRHHLKILEAHGHVVRRPQGGTVRLYENHGRYEECWSEVALLRDQATRSIHAWLADHPGATYGQTIAAMSGAGWSRSKCEKRLTRLVRAGLVLAQRDGKAARYHARPLGAPQPM